MTDVRIRPIEGTDFYYGKLAHLKVVVDENGYMNGTKLAKDAGKQLKLWTRLAGTQSFKRVIFDQLKESGVQIRTPGSSDDHEATVADLEYVVSGGSHRETWGTYLHPKLMVKFAMWCSDVYGAFVTDVMLAHHTQVTERARAKMEAKLAKKDRKLAEKEAKIAKKKAKLEEKRTLVKKKDKKIGKLEQLMADIRAENARYRKEAKKAARQAQSTMGLMREDLGEVKDDLQHVRGDLQQVSRKLGVAKKHRVIPADDPPVAACAGPLPAQPGPGQ